MLFIIDILLAIPLLKGIFYLIFSNFNVKLRYEEKYKNKMFGVVLFFIGFTIGGFLIIINHLYNPFNTRFGMILVLICIILMTQFVEFLLHIRFGLDEYDKEQIENKNKEEINEKE